MNILFTAVTPFYPRHGGVEKVTDTLCREFQHLGHKVHYLHLIWYHEEYKTYSFPADSVTILPSSNVHDDINVAYYNKIISEKKIDIIINQNGLYEGASLFCQVHNKKVKLISVIHNNPLLNYNYLWSELSYLRNNTTIEKVKRIARCLLYFKIKKQRLIGLKQHYAQFDGENHSVLVLLSAQYKQPLLQIAPHLSKKIYAIANPNSYEDVKKIPLKDKEIIFVGRLDNRSKKVNRLLSIWKNIYKEFPEWTLSIIGDGPDRDYLKDNCVRNDLKRVTFYGFSDPKPFYERASILCMTSDYEGFPMVITEAMQFGCVPIVFNSFEAIRDVVIHGITGLLIQPYNKRKYICALKYIMTDSALREKIALNAFQYVKNFNKEDIIKGWIELFNEF